MTRTTTCPFCEYGEVPVERLSDITIRPPDKLTASFTFSTEEEATLFRENAMTAFNIWRFQTGKLGNNGRS